MLERLGRRDSGALEVFLQRRRRGATLALLSHATATAALGLAWGAIAPPRCFKAPTSPGSQQHRAASNTARFDPAAAIPPLAGTAPGHSTKERAAGRRANASASSSSGLCLTDAAAPPRCPLALPAAAQRRAASRADLAAVAPPPSKRPAAHDGTIVRRTRMAVQSPCFTPLMPTAAPTPPPRRNSLRRRWRFR